MTKTQRTLLLGHYTKKPNNIVIMDLVGKKYPQLVELLKYHTHSNIEAIKKHKGTLQLSDINEFEERYKNWCSIKESVMKACMEIINPTVISLFDNLTAEEKSKFSVFVAPL